jgi:hypothetical protein
MQPKSGPRGSSGTMTSDGHRQLTRALVVFTGCLLAGRARAQQPALPLDKQDSPRAIYEQGLEKFRQFSFEEARDHFSRAYELDRNPRSLYMMAACQFRSMNFPRAALEFDRAERELEHRLQGAPPPRWVSLPRELYIANLPQFLQPTTVRLPPRVSDVLVDGNPVCRSPSLASRTPSETTLIAAGLPAGDPLCTAPPPWPLDKPSIWILLADVRRPHKLTFKAGRPPVGSSAGMLPDRATIEATLVADKSTGILDLTSAGATLLVKSPVPGTVRLDGTEIGLIVTDGSGSGGVLSIKDVPAGTHSVSVSAIRRREATVEIDLSPGELRQITLEPRPWWKSSMSMVGVAVLGAGLAAVLSARLIKLGQRIDGGTLDWSAP